MKIIIYSIALLIGSSLYSQGIKGKISYQATLNSAISKSCVEKDSKMSELERGTLLEDISKSRPSDFVLEFTENKAIFKSVHNRRMLRELGLL
ncbi:hypothetical protein [Flavicella sp.]|uniref:hypothetical protein n=1 Tax=Flavicella sp. TaxID=2957742 RepID=UPI00301901EE